MHKLKARVISKIGKRSFPCVSIKVEFFLNKIASINKISMIEINVLYFRRRLYR